MSHWNDLCAVIKGELDTVAANGLITRLRKEFGGIRVYIKSNETPVLTREDTPKSIVKKYKVSKKTAYNWLNKYKL